MSYVKPGEGSDQKPEDAGAAPAEGTQTPPAAQTPDFLGKLSDDQKAYLKGIGVEEFDEEAFAKIVETSIKQKSSVSEKSLELEKLRAQLTSQGKSAELPDEPEEEEEELEQPKSAPKPSTSERSSGISENELFDLSRDIQRDFPELVGLASDGSLFAELRQLGYFGIEGIKKEKLYTYLSQKNAQLAELRELREFKENYSKPNPGDNPTYDPSIAIDNGAEMNEPLARALVFQSISGEKVDAKRLAEARAFLQNKI